MCRITSGKLHVMVGYASIIKEPPPLRPCAPCIYQNLWNFPWTDDVSTWVKNIEWDWYKNTKPHTNFLTDGFVYNITGSFFTPTIDRVLSVEKTVLQIFTLISGLFWFVLSCFRIIKTRYLSTFHFYFTPWENYTIHPLFIFFSVVYFSFSFQSPNFERII